MFQNGTIPCELFPGDEYCKQDLQDGCAIHIMQEQVLPYFNCFLGKMHRDKAKYKDATEQCFKDLNITTAVQQKIL